MANDNSIITNYRREQLCKITSGAISTMEAITKIAFGDGGVDAQGDPIPPVSSATSLTHQIGVYPIDGVTYPIPTTARYTVTIPAADLAGTNINEAAIVDSANNLHAIKTMYSKRKDSGVSFIFTFDDEF